jgi:HlyD family secretion protein
MKRVVPLAVAAVLAAGVAAGLHWRDPIGAALGFGGESTRYLGYVEGETSLIAPPVAGRLVERPVDRGDQVKKGDRLFVIDPVMARAEVARAEAALAEAQARYENLLKGKRPEEQDVVRAQRRENDAALAQAEIEFKRQTELLAKGVGTRKDYEQAESMTRQLRSRAASLAAQ